MGTKNQSIDDIFHEFELEFDKDESAEKHKPVSFWIPEKSKAKYDKIQEKSRQKFGKKIRDVVVALIDRIDVET